MRAAGILLFTLGLLLAAGFSAAEEALITDRPDFTESAFVVGTSTRF